jgi:hypothetical protein
MIHFKQVYSTTLEKLTEVSRGAFKPQDIFIRKRPGLQKEPVHLHFSFSFRGTSYAGVLEEELDLWSSSFKDRVVELVNKAPADHGVDGRYYPLQYWQRFLFLTKAQYQYLHQPGLFE